MRKWGWTLIVLAGLALIGALSAGNNPLGPVFWLGVGIYLVYRANQKEKENKEKEDWKNGKDV